MSRSRDCSTVEMMFPSSAASAPRMTRAGARLRVLGLLTLAASASSCSSEPGGGVPSFEAGGGVTGGAAGSGAAGTPQAAAGNASGGNGGNAGNGVAGGALSSQGGISTGGAGMAGNAGAGQTEPGAPVCPEGAVFCDDFEDDAVGQGPAAPWRSDTNGASVNVETLRAFSGTNAVHVNAPTGAAYRRGYFALDQGSSNVFPALSQEFYGRAMMWLEQGPGTAAHWTFVQGEGVSGTTPSHNRLYRYGGQQQGGLGLMANFETTLISTDCWQHSQATMPVGAWACVEWRFAVASNEMQFWLDGEELEDIHVTGRGEGCIGDALNGDWLAPPAFQTLYLGWEHYQQATNDIDLWVDAVVVSDERAGCPAPPAP